MEIILLDKIVNLGGLGDIVIVKVGFVCNFFFLQGKVVFVIKVNVEKFEQCCVELEVKIVE